MRASILVLAAALALAGCGDDSGGGATDGGTDGSTGGTVSTTSTTGATSSTTMATGSGSETTTDSTTTDSTGSTTSATGSTTDATGSTSGGSTGSTGAAAECGDGVVEGDELCDDGNTDDGDACGGECDAASCLVPVTHATIQLGIDDTDCSTVWVEPGDYVENVVIGRDVALEGLPTGTVTVDGNDAGSTIDIQLGAVTLRRLTITGGAAEQGGGVHALTNLRLEQCVVLGNSVVGSNPSGGGIHAEANLAVVGTEVRLNTAQPNGSSVTVRGGGIYLTQGTLLVEAGSLITQNDLGDAGFGRAVLRGAGIHLDSADGQVDASSVSANTVTLVDDGDGEGGGISVDGGTLTVSNGSVVNGNTVGTTGGGQARGGGLWATEQAIVTVSGGSTVGANVVTSNEDGYGGGILVQVGASITVQSSTVDGNQVTGGGSGTAEGGGIMAFGSTVTPTTIDIVGSSVSGNAVMHPGGDVDGGGLSLQASQGSETTLRVSGSTISNNTVQGDDEFSGGGAITLDAVFQTSLAEATIVNSTLSGNSAGTGAGGAIRASAAFDSAVAQAHLYNVTVADNDGDLAGGFFARANIDTPVAGFEFRNTILSGNESPTCAITEANGGTAPLTSFGYNVIAADDCAMAGDTGTHLVSMDPLLGSLQDNGGPTSTMAIPVGSPARNAANPAGCVNENDAALTVDQRGELRPAQTVCDIGAYEYQP